MAPYNDPCYYVYRTPYGPLTIRTNDQGITNVVFKKAVFAGREKPSALSNRAATQLLEYFAGKRRIFNLPLAPAGSDFQRIVWEQLKCVPYGHTSTNAAIACSLNKPEAYRSVGSAVKKNPIGVIIPAHRIVGSQGKNLGTGADARLRHSLLELERKHLLKYEVQAEGQTKH